MYNNICKTFC